VECNNSFFCGIFNVFGQVIWDMLSSHFPKAGQGVRDYVDGIIG
jgi:hypothetical protein